MTLLTFIKLVALVFAIMFTTVNFGKMFRGHGVPSMNFLIQSVSIVVFIAIQFKLY